MGIWQTLLSRPSRRGPSCTARTAGFALASSVLGLAASLPSFAFPPSDKATSANTLTRKIAVFGADDRVLLPGRLKDLEDKIGLLYEPRSRSVCTAFCIDERTVATAAHCLFRTRGERALPLSNISFRLGTRSRAQAARIAGHRTKSTGQHVVTGSTSLSTRPPIDATSDWALLRLDAPACRSGGLPLSHRPPASLSADPVDRQVYQVGYHGDFGNWRLTLSPPCPVRRGTKGPEGRAVAEDFSDSSTLILHTCDTGGASSGSPLLVDGPRGPEVVGINVGTYLQSRVLTQDGAVVHRYKSDTVANTAVSTLAFLSQAAAFSAADVISDPKDIRRIQAALAATGHYTGAPDGRYGTALRHAIEAFEKSERRPATGLASAGLLRRLEAVTAGLRPADPGSVSAPRLETGSVTRPSSGTR